MVMCLVLCGNLVGNTRGCDRQIGGVPPGLGGAWSWRRQSDKAIGGKGHGGVY